MKNLSLNSVKMLSYLTQLFPLVFNEKLCEQLLKILKQLLENLVAAYQGNCLALIVNCLYVFNDFYSKWRHRFVKRRRR